MYYFASDIHLGAGSDFVKIFTEIIDRGDEVLCVTMSSGLSGTYSCANLAAKTVGGRIAVVDSGTTACGLYMLVDEAVNMVRSGLSLEDIVKNLNIISEKIVTIFSVDNLKPLRDGGRLLLNSEPSTTLSTRPILQVKSKLDFITNIKGTKARIKALTQAIPSSARRIFVMSTGTTDTREVETILQERFPKTKIHLRVLGPVLTAHLGTDGVIGISYITRAE